MNQQEKDEILDKLQAGRDTLAEAVSGVDDTLARRKSCAEQWSILECVEHMVESERYLLTRLHAATPADEPFEKSRREGKIAALAVDRTRRIEAPIQAHPKGKFSRLNDALTAFDETRAEVVRWVESCANDPRQMITDHPLIAGPVTCSETLIMIAAHPARHAKQIEEIRQVLGLEKL